MSQDVSSFVGVFLARQDSQAESTTSRPAMSESLDRRATLAPWTPLAGSGHTIETLDRLPGLARAIEVWECDMSRADEESEQNTAAVFHIPSSSSLDSLDLEDDPWHGPDPIDEWARERLDDLYDSHLSTGW